MARGLMTRGSGARGVGPGEEPLARAIATRATLARPGPRALAALPGLRLKNRPHLGVRSDARGSSSDSGWGYLSGCEVAESGRGSCEPFVTVAGRVVAAFAARRYR